MKPVLLLLLLISSQAFSQIVGGELYFTDATDDSIKVKGAIYLIDKSSLLNDSLYIQGFDAASASPVISIGIDSFELDSNLYPECWFRNNKQSKPMRLSFEQTVRLDLLVLSPFCTFNIFIKPGQRLSTYTYLKDADSSLFFLSAYYNTCGSVTIDNYDYVGKPNFYGNKDENYLLSGGFISSNINFEDSIQFIRGNPLTSQQDSLHYRSGYSKQAPLKFNGYPNISANFPRGFSFSEGTGDIRFTPSDTGISIIKQNCLIRRNNELMAQFAREFSLSILNTGSNAPFIRTQSYTSHGAQSNLILPLCPDDRKQLFFNTADLKDKDSSKFQSFKIHLLPGDSVGPLGDDSIKLKLLHRPGLTDRHGQLFLIESIDNSCKLSSMSSISGKIYHREAAQAIPNHEWMGNRSLRLFANNIKEGHTRGHIWIINGDTLKGADTTVSFKYPNSYNYQLINLSYSMCHDTVIDSLQTPSFPYVEIVRDSGFICLNDSINLRTKHFNNPGIKRVIWNSSPTASNPSFVLEGDTQFIVMVEYIDGTSNFDTLTIKPNPLPSFSIQKDSLHCEGNEIHLKALGDSSWTYHWTKSGVQLGTKTELYLAGVGWVFLNATDSLGCEASDSTLLSYNLLFNPEIPLSYKQCPNEELELRLNPPGGIVKWFKASNRLISNGNRLTVRMNADTFITSLLYDSNENRVCKWRDTFVFEMKPILDIEQGDTPEICQNAPLFNLNDSSYISPLNGFWVDTRPGQNAIKDNYFLDPSQVSSGEFSLYYETKHPDSKCLKWEFIKFSISPLPVIENIIDTLNLCVRGSALPLNSSEIVVPTGGEWSGNGVILADGQFFFEPKSDSIQDLNTIYYTLTNEKNCSITDSLEVSIGLVARPMADQRSASAPATISFREDTSKTACEVNYWLWDFGDPFAERCTSSVPITEDELLCAWSSAPAPPHRYQKSGIYDIRLTIRDTLSGAEDSTVLFGYVILLGNSIQEKIIPSFIWPNPTTGILKTQEEISRVEIWSMDGRLITKLYPQNGSVILPDQLAPGPYLIRLFFSHSEQVHTTRIIKE